MRNFLANFTKKEVIRQIYEHMRNQGNFSVNDNGSCKYRTSDGRSCAAGCFIPDSEYSSKLEGLNWNALVALHPQFHGPHTFLIRQMQMLHDEHSRKGYSSFNAYLAELQMTLDKLM